MTADLLCMGEPMLEFNQLPLQPDGTRHYLEGHGGDTSNAAIAAARQGARVGYITALGNDMPGDSFMALWAREGVDASTVIRTDRWLTGVYFVTHDAAGPPFPALPHRTPRPRVYTAADLPEPAIAARAHVLCLRHQPGHFHHGVPMRYSPRSTSPDATAVQVAYDTNYRPRLWPPARAAAVMHAAMAATDYALPGIEDVQMLTGLTDPDAMLDFYLRLGPKVVVLKMGECGRVACDTGPSRPHRAHEVKRRRCHRCRRHVLRQLPGPHSRR